MQIFLHQDLSTYLRQKSLNLGLNECIGNSAVTIATKKKADPKLGKISRFTFAVM
jgi:hypothetical protein